ncbi:MAG TPA: (Fe-S)-binding protein [Solirubrobacteraceae bacterium]|nr:(Fe-S)-binding protein [Solirubrobacteraceae bacterium]
MRIALFITCLGDTLFPQTGRATVAILERLGHTVEFPSGQTCCGQMHVNSGYAAEAMPLLERFVRAFDQDGVDAVVSPSGSCAAMVRHHYPRLAAEAGDAGLQDAVARVAPRVFELSEFLVGELGVEDVGAYFPHRVTYHPSCHATRMLPVGDAPLRLLRRVRGIDLQELPEAADCCGFGGTFAVKNAEVSAAMLTDKMAAILTTGAEVCTALDSSCLMHIGGGLQRQRSGVRTLHLAEILASTGGRSAADA